MKKSTTTELFKGLKTPDFGQMSCVPEIKGHVPVGNNILIELLTQQEISGSSLFVPEGSSKGPTAHQAYILAVSPMIEETWGLKVGQRISLNGGFVPLPGGQGKRDIGTIQFTSVVAILLEE